ncbi:hypothetical protein THRCLA_07740, partial [Thraustotheca clavata]
MKKRLIKVKEEESYEWNEMDLKKVAKQQLADAELSGHLLLKGLHLVRMPRSIQYLPHLVHIDLSHNGLTRFPGQWFVNSFANIRYLSVASNQLHVMSDILPLSKLHHLFQLDLSQNPLPLLTNRIYLLEALFRCPMPKGLIIDSKINYEAACHIPDKVRSKVIYSIRHIAPVPRLEGFPMLQELNGQAIVLEEIKLVERELQRKIRYPKTQASAITRPASKHIELRKTAKEIERRKHGFKTLPAVQSAPKLQYTVDGENIPEPVAYNNEEESCDDGMTKTECEITRRQIHLGLAISESINSDTEATMDFEQDSTKRSKCNWNESIKSLDFLRNDQRFIVREKSKVDTSLKDNPLESDVLLDYMTQAERSRRLTQKTLDVLGNNGETRIAPGYFDIYGDSSEVLLEKLNHEHTREVVQEHYNVTKAFCKKIFQVGSAYLHPEFRDIIELEHNVIKHNNNTLLNNSTIGPSLVESIDLSL